MPEQTNSAANELMATNFSRISQEPKKKSPNDLPQVNPYAVPTPTPRLHFSPAQRFAFSLDGGIPVGSGQLNLSQHGQQLVTVKSGMRMYCNGFYVLMVCWFFGLFFRGNLGPIQYLLLGAKTVGLSMVLIGEFKCFSAPRETKGLLFVFGSIVFFGMGAMFEVLVGFFSSFLNPGLIALFETMNFISKMIANVLFLSFMNRVHLFLGNARLYHKSLKMRWEIGKMVSFAASLVVFAMILVAIAGAANPLLAIVFLGGLGLMFYSYSWLTRFNMLAHETTAAIPV